MGSLEEEEAAAIRLPWARSKKLLLSVSHGLARRSCCYPMGSLEEEEAAAIRLPWARSKKKRLLLSTSRVH
jgi:hypothetical protein